MRTAFLQEISSESSSKKLIVWDPQLRELTKSILDPNHIENESIHSINIDSFPQSSREFSLIVFILQNQVEILDKITSFIELKEASQKSRMEYQFLFVPRISQVCKELLKSLLPNVNQKISSIPLYLFPRTPYVLSMDKEEIFRDLFLEQDNSVLFEVSQGISELCRTYGGIGEIFGKGHRAESVVKMMNRAENADRMGVGNDINSLIIFERPSDFIASLMTQLTYEGVLEECRDCGQNSEVFDETRFSRDLFSHTNPLYPELAGKSFNAVGQILSLRLKQFKKDYDVAMNQNLAQLKEFSSRIESVFNLKTSLDAHISIAEMLTHFVNDPKFRERISLEQEFVRGMGVDKMSTVLEEAIICEENLNQLLRLVCLQCACNGGFDAKLLQDYKRELIHSFGFGKCYLTLLNLTKVGLLSGKKKQSLLSLCPPVEDVDETAPTDPCYVFTIYAPLVAKLANSLCRLRSLDLLKSLPGPTVLYSSTQSSGQESLKKRTDSIMSSVSKKSNTCDAKVVLVFFIGGVTEAEIASLRYLSSNGFEYVIGTTNIISGHKLINSLTEEIEFNF